MVITVDPIPISKSTEETIDDEVSSECEATSNIPETLQLHKLTRG